MIRIIVATALLLGLIDGAAAQTAPAAYCRQAGSDDTLRPVPATLALAVIRLFELNAMTAAEVSQSSYFRCADHRVLVCTVGANLVCDKADTRRNLPGAAAWCAGNPGADFIPMSATGHATIYEWRCIGRRAVVAGTPLGVDPRGFIAENWKPVGSE